MYNIVMIKKRSTFFLGIFIFLIPFLGLPTSWKTALIILSALILMALSVKIVLSKKSIKHMAKKFSHDEFAKGVPDSLEIPTDQSK